MPDGLALLGDPEKDRITVQNVSTGVEFGDWLEYHYNESFFTPSDEATFRADASRITPDVRDSFYPGAKVRLLINGKTQSTGYIDVADYENDRGQGSIATVTIRDFMNPLVKGGVDPSLKFPESSTLADILKRVMLDEYGLGALEIDNEANRNIMTGATTGVRTSKRGRPLKSFVAHQRQPELSEGAYQFCERLCIRFGLHPWPAADGESVIIGSPNFDQAPIGALVRKIGDESQNNVLNGGARWDVTSMPAAILAMGSGGGGAFAAATLRGAIVNPLVDADISRFKSRWPTIQFIDYTPAPTGIPKFKIAAPVVVYTQDNESQTLEQLQHYLYRRMSELLRTAVTAHYTIVGHTLGGHPLALDTILSVDDDRAGPQGLHAPMWLMDRTFSKSRGQGSVSSIHLIATNTIVL